MVFCTRVDADTAMHVPRSASPGPREEPCQTRPPSAPPKPRSATPVDWTQDTGLDKELDKAAAAAEVQPSTLLSVPAS